MTEPKQYEATPVKSPDFWQTLPQEILEKDPLTKMISLGILRLEPVEGMPGHFDVYMNMSQQEACDTLLKDLAKEWAKVA